METTAPTSTRTTTATDTLLLTLDEVARELYGVDRSILATQGLALWGPPQARCSPACGPTTYAICSWHPSGGG